MHTHAQFRRRPEQLPFSLRPYTHEDAVPQALPRCYRHWQEELLHIGKDLRHPDPGRICLYGFQDLRSITDCPNALPNSVRSHEDRQPKLITYAAEDDQENSSSPLDKATLPYRSRSCHTSIGH